MRAVAGGIGSFVAQVAARAGASVITVAPASAADRMRSYGAAGNVDRAAGPVTDAVRASHPHGIDVLIDLAGRGPRIREQVHLAGHIRAADRDHLTEPGDPAGPGPRPHRRRAHRGDCVHDPGLAWPGAGARRAARASSKLSRI